MKLIRTISSILLALLVLMSSTSFMVGVHFCMGEVQSVALFSKADGCEEEKKLPPCHRHQSAPCCEDEAVVHSGDDFKTSASGVLLDAISSVAIEKSPVVISI